MLYALSSLEWGVFKDAYNNRNRWDCAIYNSSFLVQQSFCSFFSSQLSVVWKASCLLLLPEYSLEGWQKLCPIISTLPSQFQFYYSNYYPLIPFLVFFLVRDGLVTAPSMSGCPPTLLLRLPRRSVRNLPERPLCFSSPGGGGKTPTEHPPPTSTDTEATLGFSHENICCRA